MSPSTDTPPSSPTNIPDRLCTWCQTTMRKRTVGEGRFIHYTCPKCIFQHTSKVTEPSHSDS